VEPAISINRGISVMIDGAGLKIRYVFTQLHGHTYFFEWMVSEGVISRIIYVFSVINNNDDDDDDDSESFEITLCQERSLFETKSYVLLAMASPRFYHLYLLAVFPLSQTTIQTRFQKLLLEVK
jgi:hypothetical protein